MRSLGAPMLGRRRLREQTEGSHWTAYPDGFGCSAEEMVRWDRRRGQVEIQAIALASYLPMLLDDLRHQLSLSGVADRDALGGCADRYGFDLSAAVRPRISDLRWRVPRLLVPWRLRWRKRRKGDLSD